MKITQIAEMAAKLTYALQPKAEKGFGPPGFRPASGKDPVGDLAHDPEREHLPIPAGGDRPAWRSRDFVRRRLTLEEQIERNRQNWKRAPKREPKPGEKYPRAALPPQLFRLVAERSGIALLKPREIDALREIQKRWEAVYTRLLENNLNGDSIRKEWEAKIAKHREILLTGGYPEGAEPTREEIREQRTRRLWRLKQELRVTLSEAYPLMAKMVDRLEGGVARILATLEPEEKQRWELNDAPLGFAYEPSKLLIALWQASWRVRSELLPIRSDSGASPKSVLARLGVEI